MWIQEKLKQLPSEPGVYFMKDSRGNIIYVGKSKNLKARVSSYFHQSKNHSKKVEKLVNHLKDFDYVVTDTEFEALLLEARYIHDLQPLYNRLMKNPKSYPYLIFTKEKGYYEMKASTSIPDDKDWIIFGPYSSKNKVETAINGLKHYFKINCTNWTKPCLDYSIGKCLGMCIGGENLIKYERMMDRIIALFSGKCESVLIELEKKMGEASLQCQFEKAAELRDTLDAVKALLGKEEAIELAKEQNNLGMIDAIDEETAKFFFIKGKDVLFRKKIPLKNECVKEIGKTIKRELPRLQPVSTNLFSFKQEEIDELFIIHSSLASHK